MKTCYYEMIDHVSLCSVDLADAGEMVPRKGMLVTRVFVPAKHRGKGVATRVMKQMMADADAEDVDLWLEINPYDDGMDYDQLEAWYRRLGWRESKRWPGVYVRRPQ